MNRPPADPEERLRPQEARWRSRALARCPAREAADAARRAVLAAREPAPRRRPRWALLTAALGALAAGGLLLRGSLREPPPARQPPGIVLDQDVLLLWLDPQTPLYLHLQPPRAAGDPG